MNKSTYQPITREQLAFAYHVVLLLASNKQKGEILAKIAAKQPNLVMTVTEISEDGVGDAICDHVLETFMVLYLSCIKAGDKLPLITDSDLERAFQRIKSLHNYLTIEPDKKMWDKVVESHPEPEFWTFIRGRLTELGIVGNSQEECIAILTVEGVLEALVDARKKAADLKMTEVNQ